MKPFNYFVRYAGLSIIPALLIITCARNVNPVDDNSMYEMKGNIFGQIRNENGMLAKGVSIKLIPMDFDPHADGAMIIDSTKTDKNGKYSFTLKSSGFFNVSAQSNGKYCFEDSVYGSERDRFRINDDTLKAPGSISGIAQLQTGQDNRNIIVLVMGTNTYAMAKDSSGVFVIPDVAEGMYNMRILTLEKGYGIFDTILFVESGKITAIPGILRLPFEGIPAIGPVVGLFDSHMMRVTLSWPACDTTNIDSIFVFRNTGIDEHPLAIINKTDTSFDDDVFLLDPDSLRFGDTLRYWVAACGKNQTIGAAGVAPDILLRSVITPIDTVSLSWLGHKYIDLTASGDFTSDKDHNLYVCGYGWISKVDSIGRVCANYCDDYCQHDSGYYSYPPIIKADEKGNVYYYNFHSAQLIKFSSDLKPQLTRNGYVGTMLIDSKGQVYIFRGDSIIVFDSTLSIVNSGSVGSTNVCEWIFPRQILNDTIIFRRKCESNNLKIFKTYDIHFSQIQTLDFSEILKIYFPLPRFGVEQGDFAANGMSIIRAWGIIGGKQLSDFFFILDANNKLLGRCWLGNHYYKKYVFDGIDRIYGFNETAQSIDVYKIKW